MQILQKSAWSKIAPGNDKEGNTLIEVIQLIDYYQ